MNFVFLYLNFLYCALLYLHPALYYCCQTDRKRARVKNVNTIGAVEGQVIYEHQEAVRIWHSLVITVLIRNMF